MKTTMGRAALPASILLWMLLAPAPAAAQDAPRSTMATRLRCVALAAAVGPVAAAPGLVPLWVAGASKGLAVSNIITDALAQVPEDMKFFRRSLKSRGRDRLSPVLFRQKGNFTKPLFVYPLPFLNRINF